jgi:hypothetical protein
MQNDRDLTQAIKVADRLTTSCLSNIKHPLSYVTETLAFVASLMSLAVLMKDETDELLVLHELNRVLDLLIGQLSTQRETINASMSACANLAVVNVKGQAVLNLFTELNQETTVLHKKVARALPLNR